MSLSLFRPGWLHPDPTKRLAAVQRLAPRKLAEAALRAEHEDVFQAALGRLGSDHERHELFRTLDTFHHRGLLGEDRVDARLTTLAGHISDPVLLEDIARFWMRPGAALAALAALERLPQDRLPVIAKHAKHGSVRQAALERIEDPQVLIQLALEWRVPLPPSALARIQDPRLLLEALPGSSRHSHEGLQSRLEELLAALPPSRLKALRDLCKGAGQTLCVMKALPPETLPPGEVERLVNLGADLAELRPFLGARGWELQETVEDVPCSSCGGGGYRGNFDAPLERDVQTYECLDCHGEGKHQFRRIAAFRLDARIEFRRPV